MLLKHSENDRQVIGTCDEKDTMLRRSDQLFLAAENDHLEGSMQTEEMLDIMVFRWRGGVTF